MARSAFSLDFRPTTYFWPMPAATHIVNRINGTERRRVVQAMIDPGRVKWCRLSSQR